MVLRAYISIQGKRNNPRYMWVRRMMREGGGTDRGRTYLNISDGGLNRERFVLL
jgi:hypothetical protein